MILYCPPLSTAKYVAARELINMKNPAYWVKGIVKPFAKGDYLTVCVLMDKYEPQFIGHQFIFRKEKPVMGDIPDNSIIRANAEVFNMRIRKFYIVKHGAYAGTPTYDIYRIDGDLLARHFQDVMDRALENEAIQIHE